MCKVAINWLTRDMIADYFSHDRNADNVICNIKFKIRHTPEVYSGQMVFYDADKNVKIISDTPITAASGQYCILYGSNYEVCFGCSEILAHSKCMEM